MQAADLSKLQVRAYFDEPEIGDLQLNDPVSIVWDAKPDMTFHGHITRLPSTIITYGTRFVGEVLVSVEDSNGVLLPNTNVVVTVITQEVRHALTVPRRLWISKVAATMSTLSRATHCIARLSR